MRKNKKKIKKRPLKKSEIKARAEDSDYDPSLDPHAAILTEKQRRRILKRAKKINIKARGKPMLGKRRRFKRKKKKSDKLSEGSSSDHAKRREKSEDTDSDDNFTAA